MTIAGIDLGTTNSLIATWTDEGPRLIANALGDTLTPSAVSIADDGAVLIGNLAVDRLVTHPDRSIASFKRWMGSGPGARLAGKFYRAEELSALVLALLEGGRRQPGRRRYRRHRDFRPRLFQRSPAAHRDEDRQP